MDTVFGPKILPQDSPAIPLLEKNDTGRGVYISHLDRSPITKKITVFVLVLLANIAFVAIILWRASKNYNVVLALVLNGFHYVETGVSRTVKRGFWSWCWMLMVAALDYRLLRKLPAVVHEFISGLLWFRLRYGFRETEVVFRAPTGKEFENAGASPGEVSAGFANVCTSGHKPTRHPPWELCYAASMDAYRLADDGLFDWKNWELSVWLKDRYHQWTVREERLKTEGKDEFVATLEDIQLAGLSSASLSDPATQELLHSLSEVEGFDVEERWTEAISEADRIHNCNDNRLQVESESLY
ncbi:hypothetical protein K443DRAFT_6111 [Laccaria amethystina LaAM-08-1]|uniref:Uncharacterized protein n=1 Tax=Laccaria amethystina LaAM-08-1 TaxID=1095629 RepID=A0A0C9XLQ0_9AGAR|nr:hypothetical protein K443DRAFT_6111 [Laccaria amethystina LaAM-08-1]